MKVTRQLRWILAGAILLGSLAFLFFIFYATNSALDVWERLQDLHPILFYLYLTLICLFIATSVYFIAKLLWGGRQTSLATPQHQKPATADSLAAEIQQVEAAGMDTSEFREEIKKLEERKASGQINIAFFGDVSTGKSSIIKALLPTAGVDINLRGGSTREIKDYVWQNSSEDRLLLTDLPGRNEAAGGLDELALDEAVRAQMVVYVVDSDLTRTQFEDIQELAALGKPMVIAVNKSDLYTDTEQQQITERIRSRFPQDKQGKSLAPEVVFIQSGGVEEVVRVYPDGREETIQRPRKTDVSSLATYVQNEIDTQVEWLEQLRDSSVFTLVQRKLDESRAVFRREQAEKIVRSGTRNAMLGAMASIAPGTDLVIQGVIGTRMVNDLCKLYDVPIRQLDIDKFLDFSQSQLKKTIPLILAVAGNALKAFPGLGTVAGGLVHALAYGLIFDALGKSVALTLERRGELKAAPAALTFREMLSGNLEERTKTLARLVVDQYRQKDGSTSESNT